MRRLLKGWIMSCGGLETLQSGTEVQRGLAGDGELKRFAAMVKLEVVLTVVRCRPIQREGHLGATTAMSRQRTFMIDFDWMSSTLALHPDG